MFSVRTQARNPVLRLILSSTSLTLVRFAQAFSADCVLGHIRSGASIAVFMTSESAEFCPSLI